MWYSPETVQIEKDLVSYCLTGKSIDIPGTRKKGLQQYKTLLRNNIDGLLSQAFPITYEVLTEKQWSKLVDEFHAKHKATTPQVWKLPGEFSRFVTEQQYSKKMNLPFLKDLLLFEWIEIAVHTMEDIDAEPYKTLGNLWTDVIVVNPHIDISVLEYPVHLYAAKESLQHKGTYFLLTYRHPETDDVHFLDVSPLHVHFLDRIRNEQVSAQFILDKLMKESEQLLNVNELRKNISGFITMLFKESVMLGYFYQQNKNF